MSYVKGTIPLIMFIITNILQHLHHHHNKDCYPVHLQQPQVGLPLVANHLTAGETPDRNYHFLEGIQIHLYYMTISDDFLAISQPSHTSHPRRLAKLFWSYKSKVNHLETLGCAG